VLCVAVLILCYPHVCCAGYDNSALAGYAAAAMTMRTQQAQPAYYGAPAAGGAPAGMQQVQGYGSQAGYGYPVAGGADDNGGRGPAQDNSGYGGGASDTQQGQYGAYRGQQAVQGRVDRSYRPY
jgi:hypothetical protein